MLLSLAVQDFIIVDALTLNFSAGFTVLTGETGAGKSIILDALGLLLGDRADGTLVRPGKERAQISALFDVEHCPPVLAWLEQQALTTEEGQLFLRRSIDRQGRSRSFINNVPATLSQLKELGALLVEIHGQHAHQSLVKAEAQRALLDAYTGSEELAYQVRSAWNTWQKAKKARESAEQLAQHTAHEHEQLTWQINELLDLQLQPDEWETLNQTQTRLANAAELVQGAQQAIDSIAEQENNCLSVLTSLQTRLSKLADLDPRLADSIVLLDSINAELREVVYNLRDYTSGVEEDPSSLHAIEQRLNSLLSVARKYRVSPDQLPAKLAEWQQQLEALTATHDAEALAAHEAACLVDYDTLANALTKARQHGAADLTRLVTQQLHQLAMTDARFTVELISTPTPSIQGKESVEYQIATHAQASQQALAKIASGGELSRISLAIQVVTSEIASVPTLIFDEVDVGIGGKVAEVVGIQLRELGKHYQVLCITHLPQVASCGEHHWQVVKTKVANQTQSQITPLTPEQRVLEIARMLAGSHITDTTRQHAAEMLEMSARL